MKTWALTHAIVEHPIITGTVIVLIVVGFFLDLWLEDRKK